MSGFSSKMSAIINNIETASKEFKVHLWPDIAFSLIHYSKFYRSNRPHTNFKQSRKAKYPICLSALYKLSYMTELMNQSGLLFKHFCS